MTPLEQNVTSAAIDDLVMRLGFGGRRGWGVRGGLKMRELRFLGGSGGGGGDGGGSGGSEAEGFGIEGGRGGGEIGKTIRVFFFEGS